MGGLRRGQAATRAEPRVADGTIRQVKKRKKTRVG
jgi:hypothetical protein